MGFHFSGTLTAALAAALAAALPLAALAGPGDVHEVTADLVNLRASPSDAASVRDRGAAAPR